MRPPFCKLGGEGNFRAYQEAFDEMIRGGVIDPLRNTVIFKPDACEHVCFTSADHRWNRGPRDTWSQTRAERLPWIKETSTNPTCIRPDSRSTWVYLREMERDSDQKLPGERYAVIVTRASAAMATPGAVYFVTAFPVLDSKWNDWKRRRPFIWPAGEETPKRTKKDRGKAG